MKRFVFVMSLLLFVGSNLIYGQGVQVSGNVTGADDGTALPGPIRSETTRRRMPSSICRQMGTASPGLTCSNRLISWSLFLYFVR